MTLTKYNRNALCFNIVQLMFSYSACYGSHMFIKFELKHMT